MAALIQCSACGKDVSDEAKACPQCGHPLQPASAKKAGSAARVGCLGLLGLLGLFILWVWIGGEHDQEIKEAYLKAHPIAVAANAHFLACAMAKDDMSQKDDPVRASLGNFRWRLEGCYPNNFEDPRYWNATSPFNPYNKPWEQRAQSSTATPPTGGPSSSSQSGYARVAALPCTDLLHAYGSERFETLADPITEYIGENDADGGLGSAINEEDYVLTECRLNESSSIGTAVIRVFAEKRLAQLPPIPIGGATDDPRVEADWNAFDKWIQGQGPRPVSYTR